MSQSTASFIAYDLRPAKQIERRMLIDFVRSSSGCGMDLSLYHYIGMGGVRFIDFLIVHRYLGISDMTSVEQNQNILPRCEFNKPIGSIRIFPGEASDYLNSYAPKGPGLIWLDYDWSLSNKVQNDIVAIGSKAKVGTFLFVTVAGDPPRFLRDKGTDDRLAYFTDELGDFARTLSRDEFQNSVFRFTIAKTLLAIISFAFANRTDSTFLPLFRVIYKDTTAMVTVGGLLSPPLEVNKYRAAIFSGMSLLGRLGTNDFYEIDTLNLTEQERAAFEIVATSNPIDRVREDEIKKLGFDDSDITIYRDLIRYMPRYIESYL